MSNHIVATCYFCAMTMLIPEQQQKSDDQNLTCRPCLQRADRVAVEQKNAQRDDIQKSLPLEVGKIQLPVVSEFPVPGFTRVTYSSSKCIIAGCIQRQRLRMISLNIRRAVLSKQNIYIPRGTGVCAKHDEVEARWSDLGAYCRPRRHLFSSTHMADMLKIMQGVCRRRKG